MRFLGRSFAPAKWTPATFGDREDDLSADALTGCLRTTGSTLSFWRCSNDREGAAEVALAIASRRQRLDKVSVAVIAESELLDHGFSIEDKDGDTPVDDLRERHVNVRHLTRTRLVRFTGIFLPIARGEAFFVFTRREVDGLIRTALQRRRLMVESIDEELRKDLRL